MSVANDGAMAVGVHDIPMLFNPRRHLGLDRLGEQLLGAVTQNGGQDVIRFCGWHRQPFRGTVHLAYSYCPRGQCGEFDNTKSTPLFYPVTIHNFGLYLLASFSGLIGF
jgi:hypothetical protein